MLSEGYADSINTFFQLVGSQGTFAIGILLGCVVTWAMHGLAAKNNNLRLNIDLEREKELRAQLNLKDDRINKLHEQLAALQKKKK